MNECVDFDQTSTETPLGLGKLLEFGDLNHILWSRYIIFLCKYCFRVLIFRFQNVRNLSLFYEQVSNSLITERSGKSNLVKTLISSQTIW